MTLSNRQAVLMVCWTTAAAILVVGLIENDAVFAALATAVFSGTIPLLTEKRRPCPRRAPAHAPSTQSW